MLSNSIKSELAAFANPDKAAFFPKFFKTGKGEYGFGDKFIGITVPQIRIVAKKYKDASLETLKELLYSPIHEHRLCALLILGAQYSKSKDKEKVDFYLAHRSRVNNWDLVDSSAHIILGEYLYDKNKDILYKYADSDSLWERRIAIVSTLAFIRKSEVQETYKIALLLLHDKEDLIHKAVGWMLREAGKKDVEQLEKFLERNAHHMPRTMLRYAIEKMNESKRKYYLSRKIIANS
jgi:3-methyladenine DNA glycosylase AlkD